MLDLKGIDYELVDVLAGTQRMHLRLAGFRHGAVPALKIDGHRVQGSLRISRALDKLRPEPALFPADPERRRAVEDAERWGALDHGDELVSDRVISLERPNAATFQVLCTVRSLLAFADFRDEVGVRSSAAMARKLFPDFPAATIPPFVDRLALR
jgi:glutathione S-transferase